jgi:hypothetical protein
MKTVKILQPVVNEYTFGDKIIGKNFDEIEISEKEVLDWVDKQVASGSWKRAQASKYADQYIAACEKMCKKLTVQKSGQE